MKLVWPVGLAITLALLTIGPPAPAQSCGNTSTGLIPINDLAAGEYLGYMGGLYPDGANEIPEKHMELGLQQAALVQPRNATGEPDPAGQIGMISVGVSNTMIEFDEFLNQLANSDQVNPRLVVLNGAQGSRSLEAWAEGAQANAWQNVDRDLSRAGISAEQVQVAWVKLPARIRGTPSLDDVEAELAQLRTVLNILAGRFPNLRLTYLSSRIYAGYGGSSDAEPKAYQNGFAVKWLIEDQITGNPELNADPATGPVMAPWIAWGPYLWADGTAGRSDGLVYECDDFDDDGIHPGPGASQKVASALFEHFSTDATATGWFLASTGASEPVVPSSMPEQAPPTTGPDPTATSTPPVTTSTSLTSPRTEALGSSQGDAPTRSAAPLVGVAAIGVLAGAAGGAWYEQRRRFS